MFSLIVEIMRKFSIFYASENKRQALLQRGSDFCLITLTYFVWASITVSMAGLQFALIRLEQTRKYVFF